MVPKPHVAQPPPAVDDPSDGFISARDEATRLLGEYGKATLEAQQHANALQEQIDLLKKMHQGTIESLVINAEDKLARLEAFCQEHRAELLTGDLKHAPLLYGRVGWRTPPPSVGHAKGVTFEEAARRLQNQGRQNCVRETITVDKPAVMAALNAGEIGSADLKNAGLRIVQPRDQFYADLDHRQILKLITG